MARASSFRHHIASIVFSSSKKQMIQTNTSGIIAFVTDQHSTWNWSYVFLIGGSVRTDIFAAESNLSVAVFICRSCPDVAFSLNPKF